MMASLRANRHLLISPAGGGSSTFSHSKIIFFADSIARLAIEAQPVFSFMHAMIFCVPYVIVE